MGLYKLYKIFQDFLFNSINAYDTFFQADNIKLSDFCQMNKFDHLILKPTCFKGLLPSTIDISLTNNKQSFMRSDVYKKGIRDHHKMIILVLIKVFYHCHKNFDQDSFNKTLKNRIFLPNLSFEFFFFCFEIFQSNLDSFTS